MHAPPSPADSVTFEILKPKPVADPDGVALFAIVRNEMYFLPHLLRHYRALGVHEFYLLDDCSDDGTREFLMAQPDCCVIASNRTFGDRIGTMRFAEAVKTLLPRRLLQGRWVLIVDADEFLVLPPGLNRVQDLVVRMQALGLGAARALMLDFFPPTLRRLEQAAPDADPFSLCNWFDALSQVNWPDGAREPHRISREESVRPRMLRKLLADGVDLQAQLPTYNHAHMTKVPLVHWGPRTQMSSAHHVNVPPTDQVQLVLAHFKFYPGYQARIADAMATGGYWRNSIEYRFLDIATRNLSDWPLAGPRSRRFDSVEDLVTAGLLFSRLQQPAPG
jgi:hypothetical protein